MIKIIPIFYRLASSDPKSNTIMLVYKSKMKGLLHKKKHNRSQNTPRAFERQILPIFFIDNQCKCCSK